MFGALVLAGALGAAVALLTLRFGLDKRRVPSRIARPLTALCAVVVLIAAAAFGPRLVSHAWHSVDWMWESTAVTVLALAGVAALGARLGGGPFRLPIAPRAALVAVGRQWPRSSSSRG